MLLDFFDSIIKSDFCEELTRRTTVRVCSSILSALCVFRLLACALQTRACTLAWLTTVAAPDRRRPPSPSPWTGRPGSPQPSWRRSQGSIYRLGTSPRCYTAWRTGTPSRRSHGESFLRTYCRVDTYGRTDGPLSDLSNTRPRAPPTDKTSLHEGGHATSVMLNQATI